MSRCFPFPPPGYEKKPTTDEPDLLKKEKRKEKKHKKDKKDKEKRDGKEKREKDRSEGKHKEKKEKKDKHRDKKEKKSKSSNPDEKKVYSQFEGYNGEKVHPNDSTRSSSSSDKKQSLQFQNGEYHDHLQKKEESKNNSSDDKKSSIQFCGQNGELVRNRSKPTDTSENIKFVQELDRRIRDEEKGTGSHQFVVEGRKNSFNKIEIQKTDGRQSIMDEAGIGRNSNPTVQNKINGKTLPPFDKKIEKRVEQKEKMPEKESDDKRGDKRKNKDRDKQRQGKDKDTEKEKKEEKSKEKSEQKRAEREKNKYIRKSESITVPVPNNFPARPLENSFHGFGSEGNLKKRKDMESNGVSHENEPRPNKMGRFSSNISPENGRKLDSVQNPGSSLLDSRQGASQGAPLNSLKMGSKGQRVNGMIDPQPTSVSTKTPPFSAFNHIPTKPSPMKSPPVIMNHVAPQPPPVPATKPQPVLPNHIAPKPPPSIPNHIAARSPPLSSTPPPPPPSTTAKQPISLPKPPPAVVNKAAPPPSLPLPKKKPDPPTKPPHPDTKYLNQILSVPKLDQWCGFDDQEWLFSKKEDYPCSKKTTMEEMHQVQVWSEAKHIESVDVCALPYVIPY